MIYTDNTKKAMKLMYEKHKDQYDKSGLPYVHHPLHLADQMEDETTTIVALLHDVVEDTDTTFEELERQGFGKQVIDALKLLTHDKETDYFEYVERLSTNPIARKVKLADLTHNMDITRLDTVTEKDLVRQEKYQKCFQFLQDIESKKQLKK